MMHIQLTPPPLHNLFVQFSNCPFSFSPLFIYLSVLSYLTLTDTFWRSLKCIQAHTLQCSLSTSHCAASVVTMVILITSTTNTDPRSDSATYECTHTHYIDMTTILYTIYTQNDNITGWLQIIYMGKIQ